MNTSAIQIEPMNATDAKNRFGEVLDKAVNNTAVSLMRHGKAAAYVISPEMYEWLERQLRVVPGAVERLEREFDERVARMQMPESLVVAKNLMTIDTASLRASVRQPQDKGSRNGAARG